MTLASATLGHQGSARRAYGELLPAGDGGGAERRWLEKVVHPGHRASTAFSPRFRECGSLNHEGKKQNAISFDFFFFFLPYRSVKAAIFSIFEIKKEKPPLGLIGAKFG